MSEYLFKDWTESEGAPKDDGSYLWRLDSYDDEPDTIEVKRGKPYKNGKRQIMYGGQWKRI